MFWVSCHDFKIYTFENICTSLCLLSLTDTCTPKLLHTRKRSYNPSPCHNVPRERSTICTIKWCKLCRENAMTPYSCSIQRKTTAWINFIWTMSQYFFFVRKHNEEHAVTVNDALWSLGLRSGLRWFDCRLFRRLELGQVQTKFSLHASKGCGS